VCPNLIRAISFMFCSIRLKFIHYKFAAAFAIIVFHKLKLPIYGPIN